MVFKFFSNVIHGISSFLDEWHREDEAVKKKFSLSDNVSEEVLNAHRIKYRKIMAEYEAKSIKIKGLMIGKVCYIDSNIFMNESIDSFFKILDESDFLEESSIIVIKEQYNELYKLKSAATDVSHKARIAFRRIESLHSKRILKVNDLDKELKGSSYADIAFVDEITAQIKNGKLVALFTEDLDLKIRLNSRINSLGNTLQSNLTIYSLKDII